MTHLENLIQIAKAYNLVFRSTYDSAQVFTPEELEAFNARGLFRWGPENWIMETVEESEPK